ncbi:hypothetical protein EG835_03320, partial [bacterium]|nr:hypothetical protein [bacterium]
MQASPLTSELAGLLWAVTGSVLVSYLFRFMSGWHHLRRLYPAPAHPRVTFGTWRKLHLGWSRWLNFPSYIGAGPDGLLLRAFPVFAVVNRAVLIPWRSISVREVQSHVLYPVELRFIGSPIAPLRLPEDLAATLAAASAGNWPETR